LQTKLKGFWEKIKSFFAKLNKKTRILLGACAGVVLVLIAVAALWYNQTDYELLQGGLNATEISNLVKFLDSSGVADYQVKGDSVYVPEGRSEALQTQLALSGNLNSGFLYESYRDGIGGLNITTDEEAKLWLSAREQKLAAIIMQFDGIQWAEVQIAPATQQIYVLEPQGTPATAAVTVTQVGNDRLSSGMVESIRDLVSHSIEGMDISDVTIRDTKGNLYSQNNVSDNMNEASAMKLAYEESTSNKIRSQVLESIEYIYGPGNVKIAVNTTIDVNRKVINRTEYDQPDGSVPGGGLIGSDHWIWEIIRDGTEPVGGTVGTTTNSDFPYYPEMNNELNGDEDYAGGQGGRDMNLNETTRQEEVLAFTITDIRVAVTVNQNCENAGALSTEALRSHVATASGIGGENPENYVSVLVAPFYDSTPTGPSLPGGILPGVPDYIVLAAIGGLILFVLLLIIILILRSRAKKKRLAQQMALEEEMQAAEALAAAEAAAAAAAAAPTGGADIMEINTEKSMELRKTVRQFAQNNPEIAAQMVKAWLRGEDDNNG